MSGQLGKDSIPSDFGPPQSCDGGAGFCWTFGSVASLRIAPAFNGQCYSVEWKNQFDSLKDCFQLGSAHWYGGAEIYRQTWPITLDTAELGKGKPDLPFVTGDFFQSEFAGVMEPYWISSDGFGVRALRENPLFVGWNASGNNQLCLSSRFDPPYPRASDQNELSLRYTLCSTSDVKAMHSLALANNFWARPSGIPDKRTLTDPIWSSWARYKTSISQAKALEFAKEIRDNGFNDSQLEIDDRWETCYGELTFDPAKFPDPLAMINQLHADGFRVTLWIHPFMNIECPSSGSAKSHVVQDSKGLPATTKWWQGDLAWYFDFTRSSAADWWVKRVEKIRTDYGFDGFKVDAGETNWLPGNFDFSSSLAANATPNGYSTAYANTMQRFGGTTEIRTGYASQNVPIFTRMLDKDTKWTYENGLATLIPTLLQFGTVGYPFVLPDMIGGNGYTFKPSKELFIRWMQANVFMPVLQFSYTPWDYDSEVVQIAQNMSALHTRYAPVIISLAEQAITTGEPINRPLWWTDPLDPVTHTIDSEYLLGNDLLVAPVLQEGAVARDIYLPSGLWRDEVNPKHPILVGPMWVRNYSAPLQTLPYFTRN